MSATTIPGYHGVLADLYGRNPAVAAAVEGHAEGAYDLVEMMDRMVQSGAIDIEDIKENAYNDGHDAGYQLGNDEGYSDGYNEGRENVIVDIIGDLEELIERMRRM